MECLRGWRTRRSRLDTSSSHLRRNSSSRGLGGAEGRGAGSWSRVRCRFVACSLGQWHISPTRTRCLIFSLCFRPHPILEWPLPLHPSRSLAIFVAAPHLPRASVAPPLSLLMAPVSQASHSHTRDLLAPPSATPLCSSAPQIVTALPGRCQGVSARFERCVGGQPSGNNSGGIQKKKTITRESGLKPCWSPVKSSLPPVSLSLSLFLPPFRSVPFRLGTLLHVLLARSLELANDFCAAAVLLPSPSHAVPPRWLPMTCSALSFMQKCPLLRAVRSRNAEAAVICKRKEEAKG